MRHIYQQKCCCLTQHLLKHGVHSSMNRSTRQNNKTPHTKLQHKMDPHRKHQPMSLCKALDGQCGQTSLPYHHLHPLFSPSSSSNTVTSMVHYICFFMDAESIHKPLSIPSLASLFPYITYKTLIGSKVKITLWIISTIYALLLPYGQGMQFWKNI